MNLEIAGANGSTWLPRGGVQIDPSIAIAGASSVDDGGTRRVVGAFKQTSALSVDLWLHPAEGVTGQTTVLAFGDPFRADLPNVALYQIGGRRRGNRYRLRLMLGTWEAIESIFELDTGDGTATAQLTHLVVTRDAAGEVTIYADGEAIERHAGEGTFAPWHDDSVFALGAEAGGARSTRSTTWRGNLFRVALYERSLSHEQVRLNYAARPIE